MNTTIKIRDFLDNAMASSAGDKLRERMEKIFEKNPDALITLDFSNIELYATPFFNKSTGYFYLKFANEDTYNSKILLINLDDLGQETYNYSLDTARKILEKRLSTQVLKEILDKKKEQ